MYHDLSSVMYGKVDECLSELPDLSQTTRGLLELSTNKGDVYLFLLRQANPPNYSYVNLFEDDVFYLRKHRHYPL
jgi:hypothetical protein